MPSSRLDPCLNALKQAWNLKRRGGYFSDFGEVAGFAAGLLTG